MRLRKYSILFILFNALVIEHSYSIQDSPQSFTFQGRLFNAAGTDALEESVSLKFQIYNSSANCLLYQETQTVDLTTTSGIFSVSVGSATAAGKRTVGVDPGLSMMRVFKNDSSTQTRAAHATCTAGYTPSAGETRLLRVTVTPQSTGTPEVLSPDQVINSVPQALVAETLQGLVPTDFVQKDPIYVTDAAINKLFGSLVNGVVDASDLHTHDDLYVKISDSSAQAFGSGGFNNAGKASIGSASHFTTTTMSVKADSDSNVGLAIRANSATQSADLLQVQNSAGTKLAGISATGALSSTNSTITSADGNQLVVKYDGSNTQTLDVSSTGTSTFTVAGTAPKFGFMGGNVGIGTIAPTAKLDVAGSGIFSGTLTAANLKQNNYSFAVPASLGGATEFASVTNSDFSSNVEIWLTIHSSGYAQSKRYIVPVQFNGTNNVWQKALPISTTGPYSSNDAEIDVRISNNIATFRIRRTLGTTAGTASISLSIGGDMAGTTVANASTTYTGEVVSTNYAPTSLVMRNGNTGIGTDSPGSKLDVNGGLTLGSYSGTAAPTNGMIVSGNVGIGTTAPGNKLQINAALATASEAILRLSGGSNGFSSNNDAGTAYSIVFDGTAYAGSVVQRDGAKIEMAKESTWNQTAGGVGIPGALLFYTSAGTVASPTLTEKMRISSAGNVGIGTTTPTQKMHVQGTATDQILAENVTASANDGVGQSSPSVILKGKVWNSGTGGNSVMSGGMQVVMAQGNTNPTISKLSFMVGADGANPSEKMSITSGGTFSILGGADFAGPSLSDSYSVKIRNTATQTQGNPKYSNKLYFEGTAHNSSSGTTLISSYLQDLITNDNTNPLIHRLGFFLQAGTNGGASSEYFSILSNGNVGVGVTAPAERLEVNGNVKATSFMTPSDIKLKKEVIRVKGLDTILKLNGVRWKWISDNQIDAGVIAQELELIYPLAVSTNKKSGLKSVKYNSLIAPLIESTKELNQMVLHDRKKVSAQLKKIEELTKANQKLITENEQIKRDLASIKKKLGLQ